MDKVDHNVLRLTDSLALLVFCFQERFLDNAVDLSTTSVNLQHSDVSDGEKAVKPNPLKQSVGMHSSKENLFEGMEDGAAPLNGKWDFHPVLLITG